MKKMLWFLFVFVLRITAYGQIQPTQIVCNLSNILNETSGMLNFDGRIISHNDSGGDAKLFEVDTSDGSIIRTVFIHNATNIDWEDLAQDSLYIYIGDFGNNNSSRQDLKIYRILKADYLTLDSLYADTISFDYADQSKNQGNYDAEALIAYEDSLYIFSKNWDNLKTKIYSLSKTPGIYSINFNEEYDIGSLVTSATINHYTDEVILTSYYGSVFLHRLSQFSSGKFFNGNIEKKTFQLNSSPQVEAICALDSTNYLLSSEKISSLNATLYRFNINTTTTITEFTEAAEISLIYFDNYLTIKSEEEIIIKIFDINGKEILMKTEKQIFLGHLKEGLYFYNLIINQKTNQTGKILIR